MKTQKMMTFNVFDNGDHSVGLNGFELNVHVEDIENLNLDADEMEDFEKLFKQNLIKFFGDYSNGKLHCFTPKEIDEITRDIE